jgi:tetratricopeptide (TPR) repeat protein
MRVFSSATGRLAAIFALTTIGCPALADPTSAELTAKFTRGDYLTAARDAEAIASADDLAFAARALLAQCMTGTEEPDAGIVDRASKDAEAALKINPHHEEGKLQLAIALSLKSRRMDLMSAWTAGYGDRGKHLAEDVLKQDPRNFYAHGFLAVWNVEVERRGGGLGAWMMGASLDSAREHYEAAAKLAPEDIGVHWQYARALTALDAKAYGAEAARALSRAISAQAGDHVGQVMQSRAVKLAAALQGDKSAAQALAQGML